MARESIYIVVKQGSSSIESQCSYNTIGIASVHLEYTTQSCSIIVTVNLSFSSINKPPHEQWLCGFIDAWLVIGLLFFGEFPTKI